MRRIAETTVFLGLAIGVHLVGLTLRPPSVGVSASGEGGEAVVSLQASSASIETMVENWEKPPETPTPRTPPPIPQIEADRRDMPRPEATEAPARPDLPQIAGLAVPQAEALPDPSVTAPPPEPKPKATAEEEEPQAQPDPERERLAETRPQARPERPERVEPQNPKPEAEQRQQSSAASAGQRAAGRGGGVNAGAGASNDAATLSKGQRQTLMSRWGAQVRARIEHRKRYPRDARGASGTVRLRISVGRDGSLRGVSITRSSGNAQLDRAALQAVQSARRFPAAPKGLNDPVYTFNLPMSFSS